MKNDLNEAYLTAIKFCEKKGISSRFAQLYPFTTENIMGYIDEFYLKGKSLLTIGSSCDQAINALMVGCEDVTILDICPFTKFYFYLKKAGLLEFSYEEFQNYFCYKDFPKTFQDNQDVLNRDLFYKLRVTLKSLDYASYDFWNDLYRCNKPISIRERIFSFDEEKICVLKQMNLYLKDEANFSECKKKIEYFDPKIVNNDIFEVEFNRKFDNIWLSNLAQYLSNERFKKIFERMIENLNENGKLLMCYLYQTQNNTKYCSDWAPVYNLKETYNFFEDYLIELQSFIGVHGILHDMENSKDSILVYKK